VTETVNPSVSASVYQISVDSSLRQGIIWRLNDTQIGALRHLGFLKIFAFCYFPVVFYYKSKKTYQFKTHCKDDVMISLH